MLTAFQLPLFRSDPMRAMKLANATESVQRIHRAPFDVP